MREVAMETQADGTTGKVREICKAFRQASKEFFDDFYAKAEKDGRDPSPLQAMLQLCRSVERAIKEGWPPPLPGQPGVSTDVFEALMKDGLRLFRDMYHEAVEAHFRYTPGLKIEKRKPGRKRKAELAELIWALADDEGKTSREIQRILEAKSENLTIEAVESYRKTRRRNPQE